MDNRDRIRDFFRRVADGLVINATGEPFELLHNSDFLQPPPAKGRNETVELLFVPITDDYGVGLPPMANC